MKKMIILRKYSLSMNRKNESYEKETKHIHSSVADLLHFRLGNRDWS